MTKAELEKLSWIRATFLFFTTKSLFKHEWFINQSVTLVHWFSVAISVLWNIKMILSILEVHSATSDYLLAEKVRIRTNPSYFFQYQEFTRDVIQIKHFAKLHLKDAG